MKTIFLSFAILLSLKTLGCQCFFGEPREKRILAFKKSEENIIFKGTVIYHGDDSSLTSKNGVYPSIIIFKIDETWHGLDSSISKIKLYEMQNSCDFFFKKDVSYIVYARLLKTDRFILPIYYTTLCTPTIAWSEANADLPILGKSFKPKEPPLSKNTQTSSTKDHLMLLLAISVALNIILSVIVLVSRKNKSNGKLW